MIKKNHRSLFIIAFILTLSVLPLAGCGQGDNPKNQSANTAPSVTSEKIVLASHRDIAPGANFFYPTSLICRTWESLVGIENNVFAPKPELAESWEMSDDGRRWTFHLKKGIQFQDGVAFDADAVIANFRRYEKAPGKTMFYRFRMDRYYPGYTGIKKLDRHTVVIYFDIPIPGLPYYMAGWGSPMFSPACFDRQSGAFTKIPMGTGPFMIDRHEPDQYVLLRRFDDYWGQKPLASTIRIRVIPDVHTRYSALKAGEIQGVIDLGGMTPVLAKDLENNPNFELSLEKNSILHFIALNGERFPFDDSRMRKAFSLAINRETLSREFFSGYFPPAASILSHASPFFKPIQAVHAPDGAKALAKEVLNGKTASVDLLLPSRLFNYPYKEIAQYLQAIMADLGLDITIRQVETGGFNDVILAGDYHIYIRRQGLPHADPTGIFEDYMRLDGKSGMHQTTQNKRFHYNYNNQEAGDLLDRLRTTLGIKERKLIFNRLQDLAAVTLPVIPLVHEQTIVVHARDLKGYTAKVYGATLATSQKDL